MSTLLIIFAQTDRNQNMKNTITFIVIFFLVPALTFGQTRRAYEKKAEQYLNSQDYFGAMRYYQKAIALDSAKLNNVLGAADAARKFTAYSIAETHYLKALDIDTTHSTDALFWLGSVQNSQGKYELAQKNYQKWMEHNTPSNPLYSRAQRYIEHNLWAQTNPKFEEEVKVTNLGDDINSPDSDFGTAFRGDKMYYSSLRYLNEKDKARPKRYFSKLLVTDINGEGSRLDAGFNKEVGKHIGNLAFNPDGNVAYFTMGEYSKNGTISSQIYYAVVSEDGSFGEAVKLPAIINVENANVTHPYLVEVDGKVMMYYASNQFGGKGGLDIWSAELSGLDDFSNIENLAAINTEMDEVTPYFHARTHTVYFSSNGYAGYGDLDIFKSVQKDGVFGEVVNLKKPTNSSYNDTYYRLSEDGKKGYIASNRPSSAQIDPETGTCCNDIYELDVPVNVRLIVNTLNKLSKEVLNGVEVQIVNLTDGTIDTVALQTDGSRYFFPLEIGKDYKIVGMKDGFLGDEVLVSTKNLNGTETIEKDLMLEPKLELIALTFDKITQTPLPRAGVRLINLTDDTKVQKVNDKSNEFKFAIDYGKDYMLIAYREDFTTDTVLFSTKDMPFESETLTKKLYLEKDEGIYASLPIYFHNDEPNPRTTSVTATSSYETSYNRYKKLQGLYRKEYSRGFSAGEKQAAMDEVDRFFDDEVTKGYESLKRFADRLNKYMGRNKSVDIVIKGFASPLAPADYNVSLTKRRIDNVEKFLKEQLGGTLAPYFNSGRIKVVVEPYGETKAAPDVSDSPKNRKESVYNPKAARERRVEILQLKSAPNRTLYAKTTKQHNMKNFTFLTNKTWGVVFALALTFLSVKLSAQININLVLQHPTQVNYTNGGAEANPTGGTAPYSYAWSVSTASGHIAWSLTAGEYSVTVTDADGQSVTENFTLVVGGSGTGSSDLQAGIKKQDISCNNYNDGAVMSEATGGQPPYTYLWSTGSKDEYISNLSKGDYTYTVTDALGNTASATASIVEPIATAVTITKSQECGLPVDITVTVNEGKGPFTLMWLEGGVLLDAKEGLNSGESFTFTADKQTVYYLCTMNADGCPHDNWVPVAGGFELQANVTQGDCDGTQASIGLSPTTINGPATYSWEGPNNFVSNDQNIDNLAAGTYSVTATDAGGCTATYNTTVTEGGATMTVDENLLSSRQCEGQMVSLSNANPNADKYHWELPSGEVITSPYDFSTLGEGTHILNLVPNEGNPCAETVTQEVVVGAPAVANFDFKLVGCLESVELTDLSTAPSPITGWSWDIAGTEFKEQNPKIPADLINSEDFNAKLTIEFGDGCSLTLDKMIPVVSIEENVPPTALICEEGGSVSLNPGGSSAYQYTWSPATGLDDPNSPNPTASPSETQIYTVDIVDVNGTENCMVTQQVEVVVAPISMQAAGDTVLCDDGAMAPLVASHDGDDFAWYDNAELTGTPVSTALNFMAEPGTYYAVSTNDAGCKEVQEIQVSSSPISTGLVQDEFTLCNEDEATLEVVSPASTDLIEWFNGNELIGTGNPFPLDSPQSGEYTVVVTNEDGCTATEKATVEVIEINVEASADPIEIYRGQTADLDSDGGFMSYSWTPDDGSIDNPNTANPVITPQETTTYTLVVTDDNGCTTSSSVTVTVKETECGEPYIYLPNAFTPNGDGNGNDVLYLHGLNLSQIQLSIYNRWGQLVFETFDQSIGWDGTFNGEPVVPDVYGFYLRVTCDNGEKYFKKGNITVLK